MKTLQLLCFVQLLLVIGGYCDNCILPTATDLERVLKLIIYNGESTEEFNITISDFNVVCSAYGTQKDSYSLRSISAVVNYSCSTSLPTNSTCLGHPSCNRATVLEQVESECVNGQWSNSVLGSSANLRSIITEASLTTKRRVDCYFCLSPELAGNLSFTTDRVTHCTGMYNKSAIMLCYHFYYTYFIYINQYASMTIFT